MAIAATAGLASNGSAAIKSETVEYTHNGTTYKGYLTYDDAQTGKRPGVMVVHEWWGLNDYARKRARQLAEMGYVTFACDMYGGGKTTQHPNEAAQMAGEVRKNLDSWLGRADAALKLLRDHPSVDENKLAAIGYCFGGSTVLQLAFAGSDLKATVSFHGSLMVPTAEQAKAVKGKILVCHGAEDGFIPKETVEKFQAVLKENGTDFRFNSYPNAKHSFTVPEADNAGVDGLKYDANADKQSWADMKEFLEAAFAGK